MCVTYYHRETMAGKLWGTWTASFHAFAERRGSFCVTLTTWASFRTSYLTTGELFVEASLETDVNAATSAPIEVTE